MKVPYYGFKKVNTKTYENNDYTWIDLKVFLNVLSDDILQKFEDINPLEDENWVEKFEKIANQLNLPPVAIGDNFVSFGEFIISAKLFFMTGFTCKYGLWKKGTGTHHGIDLIMPAGTPIESFSEGKVFKIKKWDGITKNEGNCVVIESNINGEKLYFIYEHLDEIKVKEDDLVKKGDVIGTCGNSGNSTSYHLHFQIDRENAPYHPYWTKSDDVESINNYCIDSWDWLRKNYKINKKVNTIKTTNNQKYALKEDSLDLVDELLNSMSKSEKKKNTFKAKEKKIKDSNLEKKANEVDLVSAIMKDIKSKDLVNNSYLTAFVNAGILKGENGQLKLEQPLTRFQITLILYRLFKNGLLSIEDIDLRKKGKINFSDVKQNLLGDYEFKKALEFVVGNNILKGDKGRFYPFAKLTGEQFLAILGRMFSKLKDEKNIWYKSYLDWAINRGIISKNWSYIGKPIPRNEVFRILHKIVFGNIV